MFQRVAAAILLLFPVLSEGSEEIRGFISVEPYELRLEAIVKIAPFRESWKLDGETIEAAAKPAVLDNIATLFESGVNLNAPGNSIIYTGRSVRFIAPDPETGYVPDERGSIPLEEALVGITLSSTVSDVREFSGEWLWFAPGQESLVLEIASRGKPSARLLKRGESTFRWELEADIEPPSMLDVPAVERLRSRPMRHFIWLAVAMLAAASVVVIRLKQKSPSWVGWLTVLGVGLGIASIQVTIDRVEEPRGSAAEELIYGSLRNIYHAFDFRDESNIYDTLEKTVTGPLLEEVYLEIRKSLELESLGGPRVKVYEIALRDWEGREGAEKDRTSDPVYVANWATIGEVTHWGHTHERTNRYEAEITFVPQENYWKVSGLELLNEERVQKVSRREVIPEEATPTSSEP